MRELPSGRYLNCPIDLSPDAGGQTRAMLMRNRIFVTEAGIAPVIVTFNARTDWEERRRVMLERGLLLPEISTPNIYEHYRTHGWDEESPPDSEPGPARKGEPQPLADLSAYKVAEEFYPDGTPFRVTYRSEILGDTVHDHQRADGSTYLRIPQFVFKEPKTWPRSLQRVGRDGTVLGEFGSVGEWFKRFVRHLAGGERAFLFIDSRFSAQHLVPMAAHNIHIVYVLHNIHVMPPRLWSSDLGEIYARLIGKIAGTDAFVTLTARQRDDIAQRRGRTSNLFVIPNPVDMPERRPDLPPRDPHRVTVVARLERQKRLGDAIRAFAKAAQKVPEARLDIYGSGSQLPVLADIAAREGVADAVTLHGHDPRAREALWQSSAFLMTSSFEGYPLSTLESLSHGCPVIAYDIKYGPREQVTDGADGFLVPAGDIDLMAERIVTMLTSPDLVERMSAAAMEKARQHGHGRFLDDWRQVLEKAVELKPFRTHIDHIGFEVARLEAVGKRRLRRRWRPVPTRVGRDGALRLEGTLHVRGHSRRSRLDDAEVTLTAVHAPTGRFTDLPLRVERVREGFRVATTVTLADVLDRGTSANGVRLRLRLVWQNRAWDTYVQRPEGPASGIDVGYASDDAVELNFR